MAETNGLLNRRTGKSGTEGSNPSVSARARTLSLRTDAAGGAGSTVRQGPRSCIRGQCAQPRPAPGAAVVTLQNGVEAPDQAAEAPPNAAIVTGWVHGPFEFDRQQVRHVGVAPNSALGMAIPACMAAKR